MKSPPQILPPQALQHRLIAALGADKVRNVVVARAPDDRAEVGHTAWLAPYLSFARGAPVVLTHAQGAAVAEADVQELIRRESLQPRTVTILADYASIGYRYVELDPSTSGEERPRGAARLAARGSRPLSAGRLPQVMPAERLGPRRFRRNRRRAGGPPAPPPHYTVRTEPFVPSEPDQLATLGVGRIPLGVAGRLLGFLRPRAACASGCWPIARRGC